MSKLLINITHKQAIVFAAFLVLYEFLTYIANDMIMPGMLQVVAYFHAPATAVATSLTMYMLGGASLQIFLGPLSDCFGRRPVMMWGAGLFFIFTMFISCSFSMTSFLAARFFQGTGLCFISVVGYAVLQEILVEKEAIRLMTIMSNVAILAPLVGPIAGVVFLYYVSWRFIFIILGGFSLLAFWGLWRYMPESVGVMKKNGEQTMPMVFSMSVIKKSYVILLKSKKFILGNIMYGLLAVPCIVWIALSPRMIVSDAHLSLMTYGLWQLPVFGAYILGNFTLSRLINRLTLFKCMLTGFVAVVVGLIMMWVISYFYPTSFEAFMPGLTIYFFGYSLTAAPLNRFLLYITNVGKGTTSAFISVFSMCTQALGIEVINLLYSYQNYKLFSIYSAIIGLFLAFFVMVLVKFDKNIFFKIIT